MSNSLAHISKIKEIVEFLNQNFPPKVRQKFIAYLEKDDKRFWNISCNDMLDYNSKEFVNCTKAVYELYPELKGKVVFSYLYYIWTEKLLEQGKIQDKIAIVVK